MVAKTEAEISDGEARHADPDEEVSTIESWSSEIYLKKKTQN